MTGSGAVVFATGNYPGESSDEPVGTARTAADLSGRFRLRWDNTNPYLAVEVVDIVSDVVGSCIRSQWSVKDAVALFLDVGPGDGADWRPGDHAFDLPGLCKRLEAL